MVRSIPDNPCPAANGTYVDHYGGLIRNNIVFANQEALFTSGSGFDCGICLWTACNAKVLHNTVFSSQPPFSSIEWRFSNTWIDLTNNLVNYNLRERDGAHAVQGGNVTDAQTTWFVNAAQGDLHLTAGATGAIDQGVPVPEGECNGDIDGNSRPMGFARDVGADEFGTSYVADHAIYLPLINR